MFSTISTRSLFERLNRRDSLLILDARRKESLSRNPFGIAGAVPMLLDDDDVVVPDVDRDREIVVYCLCTGQASSTRVAQWLGVVGYQRVSVLEGGLPAWLKDNLPKAPIRYGDRFTVPWASLKALSPVQPSTRAPSGGLIAEKSFLVGLHLPVRREMAVLFVDMVDSTRLVLSRPPEETLELVQSFMEVVVDIAVQHCGDVHDFEGDGAMLYFAGPGEAVPAAFRIRSALDARRHAHPELPTARFALDCGPLVIGYIGSRERRDLSFIGPCVNRAARILKHAPADGIIATDAILEVAKHADPDLANQFRAAPDPVALKGFDEPQRVHIAAANNGCDKECPHE